MPTIAEIIAARTTAKSADSSPQIDVYAHAEAPRPMGATTLSDLLDSIRSDEYADRVDAVRQAVAAGDKDAASQLKKRLPAVSISGCCDGRRKAAVAEGRFTHSGLIQIDIDGKENPGLDLYEARNVLIDDPRVVAVFDSPGGNGIKGIGRIPRDPARQLQSFQAVEAHFASLGIKIDTACKDPVRLCFVSHDPAAWSDLNRTAEFEPLDLDLRPHDDVLEAKTQHEGLVIRAKRADITLDDLRDMLAKIGRPNYERWLEICSGAWAHFGEQATAVLAAAWPEERPGEYAEKFANRLTKFSLGTVWHYAVECGWRPGPGLKKSLANTSAAKVIERTCEGFPQPERGESSPIAFAPRDIFFDAPTGKYLVRIDGSFHTFGKRGPIVTGLTRYLAKEYTSPEDLKAAVKAAIDSREVDGAVQWAGAIAGLPQGMTMDHNGLPMLVTSQANTPVPAAGECEVITDILQQAFPDPNQFLIFLGWLSLRYKAVMDHKHVPAPMLVIAGEVNSGKSLIGSTIVEKILGGRSANPYVAWSGGMLWNDDLIGSELLLIDDTVASTDIRSRRDFGAAFKEAIYPNKVAMRKRNCSTIHIRPVWSVVVCCNNTPEALQIIPPLDSDLEDKVILLSIHKIRPPVDTSTPAGRRRLEAMIEAELPAFAHALMKFEIPESMRDSRSGIVAFRDQELRDAIEQHSPAKRLLELLESATKDRGIWFDLPADLTAAEIEGRLTDHHSGVRDQAKALFSWHGACGSALAKLAKSNPDVVEAAGVDGHAKVRKYRIKL